LWTGRNKILLTAVALAAAAPIGLLDASSPAQVTAEQVRRSIRRGVAYIRQRQQPGGAWARSGHRGGATALNVLAMLNAGVGAADPQIQSALRDLAAVPDERTYVAALKCQVYAAVMSSAPDDRRTARQLNQAADFLIRTQLPNGMWGYGRNRGRGDNSNTQFALLGLHEAAKAGVKVPANVWSRASRHFARTQGRDGGWSYVGRQRSYGSMTAAGVASLYIAGQQLHVGGPKVFKNGAYPYCGQYRQNVAIVAGLNWLTRNFSVRLNPGRNNSAWLYYYLYGLERVGMISGLRNFGPNDWYRKGAAFLVANQRGDGGWGNLQSDTAFAILYLAKGNRPVLIQKLQWDGRWNRSRHDLANLTAFIDDKLGKKVTWQTTSLDLPVTELRQAPILFLTGHEFPEFTAAEKLKLRQFVETGGTLLAEACCGSKAFAAGFRKLAGELFSEYRLRPLGEHHPIFRSYYKLSETYGLEGIDVGCRTSVFFSPRALSSLWELRTIPTFSDYAFKLGTNVAAYATGRELLSDKLEEVELPAVQEARPAGEIPRGAVRLARLIHDGDYNADPHAMQHLAAILRDRAGVDVVARSRHLRADDEALFEYPVVFMTGHFSFKLSAAEIEALRLYLQRGGFLFADACCGREAFDKSFRRMVGELFAGRGLKPLPGDHPIYTGEVGAALGELRYRRILAEELKSRAVSIPPPKSAPPPIEAVVIDGRTVIMYSKYDFSCGLEGDNPYSSRGYVDADARKLAMNVVLYGIGY